MARDSGARLPDSCALRANAAFRNLWEARTAPLRSSVPLEDIEPAARPVEVAVGLPPTRPQLRTAEGPGGPATRGSARPRYWPRHGVGASGRQIQASPRSTPAAARLGGTDEGIRHSMSHFYAAREALHGNCFYLGLCKPVDDTERLIRETGAYIDIAELLAAG